VIEGIIGTVIGTIIGTVLGFFLSEWGTKGREERTEKKQSQGTRTIINLEINRNLESLRQLWQDVNQNPGASDDTTFRKQTLGIRFTELPFPASRREGLDSQLSFLPSAFKRQEIEQVFQFYDSMNKLEEIRMELALTAKEFREGKLQVLQATGMLDRNIAEKDLHWRYEKKMTELWDEVEPLVTQLVARGNPLTPTDNGR
jgi:hypothetical protein